MIFYLNLHTTNGYSRCPNPKDGRKIVFCKCRIEPEKSRTIGVYEALYFKDISPEDRFEEYLRELERI